jgi:hypothetical protein
VQPPSLSPTHDPDLDPPRGVPATYRRPPLPQEYQRLVANPFLALFWLIVLSGVFRNAVDLKSLPLLGVAVLGLVVAGYLLHYHCLDCGATGRLFRWKEHACPSVVARQQAGRVRRIRGPNPYLQTILWGYVLGVLAVLVYVVRLALGD